MEIPSSEVTQTPIDCSSQYYISLHSKATFAAYREQQTAPMQPYGGGAGGSQFSYAQYRQNRPASVATTFRRHDLRSPEPLREDEQHRWETASSARSLWHRAVWGAAQSLAFLRPRLVQYSNRHCSRVLR